MRTDLGADGHGMERPRKKRIAILQRRAHGLSGIRPQKKAIFGEGSCGLPYRLKQLPIHRTIVAILYSKPSSGLSLREAGENNYTDGPKAEALKLSKMHFFKMPNHTGFVWSWACQSPVWVVTGDFAERVCVNPHSHLVDSVRSFLLFFLV